MMKSLSIIFITIISSSDYLVKFLEITFNKESIVSNIFVILEMYILTSFEISNCY